MPDRARFPTQSDQSPRLQYAGLQISNTIWRPWLRLPDCAGNLVQSGLECGGTARLLVCPAFAFLFFTNISRTHKYRNTHSQPLHISQDSHEGLPTHPIMYSNTDLKGFVALSFLKGGPAKQQVYVFGSMGCWPTTRNDSNAMTSGKQSSEGPFLEHTPVF